MAEPRSALASHYAAGRIGAPEGPAGVAVWERAGRTLAQVSGWPGSFDDVCRRLQALCGFPMPASVSMAISRGARTVFRVGPERLWFAGPAADGSPPLFDAPALGPEAVITDIGHSRTVVRVVGDGARELLNRGLPVDLDAVVFPEDSAAQSVIHHMSVLVHRVPTGGADGFDAYVTSDYAASFWEWLTEAAQSFGCEIRNPQ